jgi:hypothetical protein
MWVRAAAIEGVVGGAWSADDLGAAVVLPGGAHGGQLLAALQWWAAALDGEQVAGAASRAGLDPVATVGHSDGLCGDLGWPEPQPIAAWLDSRRRLRVTLTVVLDPPRYATLREAALRDPTLALALADGSEVTVQVGWLWTVDGSAAAPLVHGVAVGGQPLPLAHGERPAWLTPFLRGLGAAIGAAWTPAADLGDRLLAAQLAPDPDLRARSARLAAAFAGAPFGWGSLGLVRRSGAVSPAFGAQLTPLAQLGQHAPGWVGLAAAAWLDAPDVLLVDLPVSPAVRRWLEHRARARDATLEQFFVRAS